MVKPVENVTVKYTAESPTQVVQQQGGYTGGTVNINKNSAVALAKPVKEDIDNNIAENPWREIYDTLTQWVSNDQNNYKFQKYVGEHKKEYDETQKGIKATDEDGNEFSLEDAAAGSQADISSESMFWNSLAGTLQTVFVEAAKPMHATKAAGIFMGWTIACSLFAVRYDQQLDKREAFANSVEQYVENTKSKLDTIQEEYDNTLNDRKARIDEATNSMTESAKGYTSALGNMKKQLEDMIANNASQEEIQAFRDSMVAAAGSEPLSDGMEAVTAILEEGYDSFFSLLTEAQALYDGYSIIAEFLSHGEKFGENAKLIAMSALSGGLQTVGKAGGMMLKAAFKGKWWRIPIQLADAGIGIGILAAASVGNLSPYVWGVMIKKAKKEFKCAKEGENLTAGAIIPLATKLGTLAPIDQEVENHAAEALGIANQLIAENKTAAQGATGNDGEGGGDNGGGGGGGDNSGGGGSGDNT